MRIGILPKTVQKIEMRLLYECENLTEATHHSMEALIDIQELLLQLLKRVEKATSSNGYRSKLHRLKAELESDLDEFEETQSSVSRYAGGHWPCCSDIECSAGSVRRAINRLWELKERLVKHAKVD